MCPVPGTSLENNDRDTCCLNLFPLRIPCCQTHTHCPLQQIQSFFFFKDGLWFCFFFIYIFIYLFLATLVFVAACGLSLVAASGATLCCCAQASHCGGFSCCGARALGARASVVVTHGLSSCGSQALERRLSSCGTQA